MKTNDLNEAIAVTTCTKINMSRPKVAMIVTIVFVDSTTHHSVMLEGDDDVAQGHKLDILWFDFEKL